MVKVISVFVLALASGTILARDFPPNDNRILSDEEIAQHPTFKRTAQHRAAAVVLPKKFDARQKWPGCKSIALIRDQGQCSTCYAVSSASVISDRVCIVSGQKINDFYSGAQAASCARPEKSATENCGVGGDVSDVYKHAALFGIVTGGEFNSNVGCVPYTVPSGGKPPITCTNSCTNKDYKTAFAKDTKIIDSYWINYRPSTYTLTPGDIADNIKLMKEDLVTNGPITASMKVWTDFQEWVPAKGPYNGPAKNAEEKGGHAVRIIGWDETKEGVAYWLIANSWGERGGDKGIYWIKMGSNCVGIEAHPAAPIISQPSTCTAASFCDTPITHALRAPPNKADAPVYLFQGECTLEIKIKPDGTAEAVGAPVPLSKQFLGAPPGPITSTIFQKDQKLYIVNGKGVAGSSCERPDKATKFKCGSGTGSASNRKEVVFGANSYVFDGDLQWVFDTNLQGINAKEVIKGVISSVDGAIDVNGKSMLVFGKDLAGKPVAGVLTYPTKTTGFAWATKPGPVKSVLKC